MAVIEGVGKFKVSFIKQVSALLTAAFGLVAALAWNGAIQAILKEVFGTSSEVVPMLIYAVVVTGIAVAITLWIAYVAEKLGANK
ncbi:MAG: DUF5654 family protein [Candidatus Marsarchaeota archaeon]|jgi:hypothetical protein|nr:DUF5654 family protein [Candidatus Marsarchaeota archaeon]MCL5112800.1 DUF5654 family protein [Candidatus Marsarchaeota archaeon]